MRHGWGVPLPSSDTFTYTGAPNPAKWNQAGECWPGNAGNGQRCASHTTVGEGFLRETGDAAGNTGWLANVTDQKYGRWEARARMAATGPTNTGNPYHPVLLLWPQSERWTQDGEDDYAETHIGADGIDAFIHHPTPSGVVQDQHSTRVDPDQMARLRDRVAARPHPRLPRRRAMVRRHQPRRATPRPHARHHPARRLHRRPPATRPPRRAVVPGLRTLTRVGWRGPSRARLASGAALRPRLGRRERIYRSGGGLVRRAAVAAGPTTVR